MAELIEPCAYDAVAVSSGVPELLLASALARAGRCVLVLDPADAYGATWASLAGPDFVHALLTSQCAQQRAQQQAQAQQAQQAQQLRSGSPAAGEPGEPLALQQQPGQLPGVLGCRLLTHPSLEAALADKGLLVDLAPRVLYQDEPLVQLLVSCQAHNYLEFKLVEGSYIWAAGRLRPVPASRADLFADRALSLADKRSLGRFLAACVEAQAGQGRLKDAFDSRPLVQLLAAEGLNQQLQEVVLYGIAMADTPQALPPAQQQPQPHSVQQPEARAPQLDGHAQPQQPQAVPSPPSLPAAAASSVAAAGSALLSAAEGLAALELYSRSLGRHGGSGAFMAACFGSGSLAEALVRLAAVKGAVTALRRGTRQLVLLPPEGAAANPAGEQQQQAQVQQKESAGPAGAAALQQQAAAAESSAGEAAAAGGTPAPTLPQRVRIVLETGQALTAGTVLCSSSSLPCGSSSSSSSNSQPRMARAVAVLDSSLVEGDSSLLLVLPPRSLGPEQAAVVRGLQLGAAMGVAPAGHCLLYLSAVLPAACDGCDGSGSDAPGRLAEQVLGPALAALAATAGLQHVSTGAQDSEAAGTDISPAARTGSSGSADAAGPAPAPEPEAAAQQQDVGQPAAGEVPLQPRQPQALAACFYLTRGLPDSYSSLHSGGGDAPLLACPPAPAHGFAGYSRVLAAAEAAFRQHFPGLPWLSDPVAQPAVPGGGAAEDGGSGGAAPGAAAAAAAAAAAGGGLLDEDEADAIDELTAALAELSAGLKAGPAPER